MQPKVDKVKIGSCEMASHAPAVSTPGEEMTVVPEMKRTEAQTPGLGDADDKKQFEPVDLGENGDRYPSASYSNEASLDDKASEVAQFKKKLPAIQWKNGPGAFFSSLGRRIRAAATPRLLLCILIGQTLSLCITTTSVVTTELSIGAWSLPATQVSVVRQFTGGNYSSSPPFHLCRPSSSTSP